MSDILEQYAIADYSPYKVLVYQNRGSAELIDYFVYRRCRPVLASDVDVVSIINSELFDLYIIDNIGGNRHALFDMIKKVKPGAIVWYMSNETSPDIKNDLYERGIDLYIERPTNLSVLFALFTATIKNRAIQPAKYVYSYMLTDAIKVDNENSHIIYIDKEGEEIGYKMSDKAMQVLNILYTYRNNTVQKTDLVKSIFGCVNDESYHKLLKIIDTLRDRLKKSDNIEIRTIYRVGFMLFIKDNEREKDNDGCA